MLELALLEGDVFFTGEYLNGEQVSSLIIFTWRLNGKPFGAANVNLSSCNNNSQTL